MFDFEIDRFYEYISDPYYAHKFDQDETMTEYISLFTEKNNSKIKELNEYGDFLKDKFKNTTEENINKYFEIINESCDFEEQRDYSIGYEFKPKKYESSIDSYNENTRVICIKSFHFPIYQITKYLRKDVDFIIKKSKQVESLIYYMAGGSLMHRHLNIE